MMKIRRLSPPNVTEVTLRFIRKMCLAYQRELQKNKKAAR